MYAIKCKIYSEIIPLQNAPPSHSLLHTVHSLTRIYVPPSERQSISSVLEHEHRPKRIPIYSLQDVFI